MVRAELGDRAWRRRRPAATRCARRRPAAPARLRQRAVLDQVDGDVPGQVVDPVQRLVQRERQRLGRASPTTRAPISPGPAVTAMPSISDRSMSAVAGPAQRRQQRLQVGPAGHLGDHTAEADVLGDAGRDLVGQQLGARGPCRRRSRRRTTRSPGSADHSRRPPRGRAGPAGPARQVPEPQDQRVPTRPVVVVTGRQLLEPEPLVQGDRRVVVLADLEHHRARARRAGRPPDRRRPGPRRCPVAGARRDHQPVQIRESPTVCSAITPTGTCARASSVVRPSPSSSPCQLRSLHCSFGAKPASSRPMIPGRSSSRARRDADPGSGGAHPGSAGPADQHGLAPAGFGGVGSAQIERLAPGVGQDADRHRQDRRIQGARSGHDAQSRSG